MPDHPAVTGYDPTRRGHVALSRRSPPPACLPQSSVLDAIRDSLCSPIRTQRLPLRPPRDTAAAWIGSRRLVVESGASELGCGPSSRAACRRRDDTFGPGSRTCRRTSRAVGQRDFAADGGERLALTSIGEAIASELDGDARLDSAALLRTSPTNACSRRCRLVPVAAFASICQPRRFRPCLRAVSS